MSETERLLRMNLLSVDTISGQDNFHASRSPLRRSCLYWAWICNSSWAFPFRFAFTIQLLYEPHVNNFKSGVCFTERQEGPCLPARTSQHKIPSSRIPKCKHSLYSRSCILQILLRIWRIHDQEYTIKETKTWALVQEYFCSFPVTSAQSLCTAMAAPPFPFAFFWKLCQSLSRPAGMFNNRVWRYNWYWQQGLWSNIRCEVHFGLWQFLSLIHIWRCRRS